jgi:hypothetical protein
VEIAVVVVKVHWVTFLAVERPQNQQQQLMPNLKSSLQMMHPLQNQQLLLKQ